jgi:hypothetical protein
MKRKQIQLLPLLLLLLVAACTQTTEQMPMGQMDMAGMGGMMDDGMMGWSLMVTWFWWLLGCLFLLLLVAVLAAGYFWGKQRATNEKTADS